MTVLTDTTLDAATAQRWIDGGGLRGIVADAHVVASRPGRAVYRIALRDGRIVGAKVRARRAEALFRIWRSIRARADDFTVPVPLAYVPDAGCILFEWIEAPDMHDALAGTSPASAARACAQAMSSFHRLPAMPLRTFTAEHAAADCHMWIARASSSGHPRVDELQSGARAAEEALAAGSPQELAVAHRDFYPRQVLDARPPVILDFDLVSLAEPSLDAGNFSAHLLADGLAGARDPFLDDAGGDTARVTAYEALTLARVSAVHWVRGRPEAALAVAGLVCR